MCSLQGGRDRNGLRSALLAGPIPGSRREVAGLATRSKTAVVEMAYSNCSPCGLVCPARNHSEVCGALCSFDEKRNDEMTVPQSLTETNSSGWAQAGNFAGLVIPELANAEGESEDSSHKPEAGRQGSAGFLPAGRDRCRRYRGPRELGQSSRGRHARLFTSRRPSFRTRRSRGTRCRSCPRCRRPALRLLLRHPSGLSELANPRGEGARGGRRAHIRDGIHIPSPTVFFHTSARVGQRRCRRDLR